MKHKKIIYYLLVMTAWLATSCSKSDIQPSPEVTSLGKVEVTARLTEILGTFPKNDLYDYTYIMKYQVLKTHRGSVDGSNIFVGHYNPLKPRVSVTDKFSGKIGGNVDHFVAGQVHRMALDYPLDQCYMGGVIDKHIMEQGIRYWALWTDRARE